VGPKADTPAAIAGLREESPVAYALVRLAKHLRAEFETRLAPLGVHAGQDRLMEEIWREDGLRQGELIERLGLEPPTVTGILQRLEREGFISRRPDPERGRVQRVFLTEAGRKLERPVRKVWSEVEDDLLAGITVAERRELLGILTRLLRE
jgi:MarR family transcriptional regulator, organic hydroperoxide resistance regulator